MNTRRSIAIPCLLIISCVQVRAQDPPPQGGQRMMMRFDADKSVMLREVMAIVGEEKGKLTIMMVPPADRRPEGMLEVDLQRGDEVGMAAGKRITSIKELRAAYDGTKPGEEFKIGVRREGRSIVVTFKRKEDSEMPRGGTMVMRRGPGDENSDVFPALGLVLEKKEAGVIVSETLPHASKDIHKGDVVSTLNGTVVKTVADFAKALDATKVGAKLDLLLTRKGDTVTVSIMRPEPRGMMRIER